MHGKKITRIRDAGQKSYQDKRCMAKKVTRIRDAWQKVTRIRDAWQKKVTRIRAAYDSPSDWSPTLQGEI